MAAPAEVTFSNFSCADRLFSFALLLRFRLHRFGLLCCELRPAKRMLDVVDVGQPCGFPGCSEHDFLPTPCATCGAVFCAAHATSHRCVAAPAPTASGILSQPTAARGHRSAQAVRNAERRQCPVCVAQKKPSTIPPVLLPCGRCGYRSCIAHRHHYCLADGDDTPTVGGGTGRAPLSAHAQRPSIPRRAVTWLGVHVAEPARGLYWRVLWMTLGQFDDVTRKRVLTALPLVVTLLALAFIGKVV